MELTGNVIVTGAASGIGKEVALTFAERGASTVIIADLNFEGAKEVAERSAKLAQSPHYRCLPLQVDITDRGNVQAAFAEALKYAGRIDYCVNSAGVGPAVSNPITEISIQDYDRLNNINNKGLLFCVGAAAQIMANQAESFTESRSGRRSIGRGSITNVISRASYNVNSNFVQYSASKHAAMAVTKTAALELSKQGIRVNAVCPSFTDTPMLQAQLQREPGAREMVTGKSPLGRLASAEEVAGVCHFLSSPDASYINGQGLVIDAGGSLSSFA